LRNSHGAKQALERPRRTNPAASPELIVTVLVSSQSSYQSEQIWGDLLDLIWRHKTKYACQHSHRSFS
jgi:hypothetical protein